MKIYILVLLLSFIFTAPLKAENIYVVINKQQEKKKQSRWSLGEWMIQQRKIRLMDQWLALNTEEIGAEWRLHYSNVTYERNETGGDKSSSDLGLEVFYGFIGVSYEQFSGESKTLIKNTALKLKLIGSSQQSTHLNLVYGISKGDFSDSASSTYLGYEGDLYLFGSFGYHFRYEDYTPDSKTDGTYFSGIYRLNSLFIESGFIRLLYGIYELDYRENTSPFIDKGTKIAVEFNF